MKVNGTHARDIALHYVEVTGTRVTPAIMAKTVQQAKSILASGYTKEEIMLVIDTVTAQGVVMYSLGYVSASINNVLRQIAEAKEKERLEEEAKIQQALMAQQAVEKRSEVKDDDESTKRNRDKAKRIGVQSRVGKKHNFDLFER